MIDGFTALVFGFCAAIAHDKDFVEVGYISENRCIVRLDLGETHGQTITANGHEIGVEMTRDGGAVIIIDEQRFSLVRTEGA